MLLHLALGLALGVGSSLCPGPCNLAVITAAARHGRARAVATGLGAALGDASYAALGILGAGPLLARHPALPPVLQAASGVALIGYGLAHLRDRVGSSASGRSPRATRGRGVAVGLATLLANPGALVTWVVIVGSLLATASPAAGACTVIGIGVGSFAWFSLVACLTSQSQARCGAQVRLLTAAVSRILVVCGVVSLVRAVHVWLGT